MFFTKNDRLSDQNKKNQTRKRQKFTNQNVHES